MKKLLKYFTNSDYRFLINDKLGLYKHWDDERFLKRKFKARLGYELDLENPQTFNEKLQWLKIHDHNPEYTKMVDKYECKKYVADIIGEKYIIPTLGVWDCFEDIDFSRLPDRFVLKCTHDSGGIIICKEKSKFNIQAAKKKLNKSLKRNFYYVGREWPYKDVKPRIIAEPYLTDESGIELKDYKIFNFSEDSQIIEIDFDRFSGHKRNLYTEDWQYIEAAIEFPTDPNRQFEKPKVLDEMLSLAKKLSENHPHLRTDFYCIDNRVLFGELTFYHGSGFEKFIPDSLDIKFGEWIKLPRGGS